MNLVSIPEICLTVGSVVGAIYFCQFMYEIWDEKAKRKARKNWDKFDNF